MKITNNIQIYSQKYNQKCNPGFKSQTEWYRTGIDSSTQELRDFLMNRHYANMKRGQFTNLVNCASMENIPLGNIQWVDRAFYRGSSPKFNLDAVLALKNAGIQRIIDFAGFPEVEEACRANRIDYYKFLITEEEGMNQDLFLNRSCFKTEEEAKSEAMEIFGKKLGLKGKELETQVRKYMDEYNLTKREQVESLILRP